VQRVVHSLKAALYWANDYVVCIAEKITLLGCIECMRQGLLRSRGVFVFTFIHLYKCASLSSVVTRLRPAKTAAWIEVLFEADTLH